MPLRLKIVAKEFNVGISTIVEFLAEKGYEITNEPNLIISDDIYALISTKYNEDRMQKVNANEITKLRQLQSKTPENDDNLIPKRVLSKKKSNQLSENVKDNLDKSYSSKDRALTKTETELLKEFMSFNSIDDLIFKGEYYKHPSLPYGRFKSVHYHDGKELKYPNLDKVENVYIGSHDLIEGATYIFEATLAPQKERIKYSNHHLLKSKVGNIPLIKELSGISKLLNEKQEKLDEINQLLSNAEDKFESTRKENEDKLIATFKQKQKEINTQLDSLNQELNLTQFEVTINKTKLNEINLNITESNNNLIKMERLIETLKNRVALCKNLNFISGDDEDKYINLLSDREYNPLNHHDFVSDFGGRFSELADHIHAYLYHKKDLIYTQFQIRNFLTLLRTNDIIVLSGLSGSGKTQIIKSFA
jgi:hypothetical protein